MHADARYYSGRGWLSSVRLYTLLPRARNYKSLLLDDVLAERDPTSSEVSSTFYHFVRKLAAMEGRRIRFFAAVLLHAILVATKPARGQNEELVNSRKLWLLVKDISSAIHYLLVHVFLL